ncbi:MAG: thioredoxin family protein [Saprospiraceae bacterium]|nr:thioredoxin family protein [Saprospiraceae bacterium]
MRTPITLLSALIACLLFAISSSTPKGYAVGDVAEDFTLKSVTGEYVSLSDYKDAKGVIVVFTCNHCPFAQLYEQRIIDLHKKYAPQGYPVVAINPNSPLVVPEDGFDKMQERANSRHYPFPYLFDEHQTVFPKFGATRTPHVFLLDETRAVRYIGSIDNNAEAPGPTTQRYVENAIEALMRGESPSPASTKSVGCTIKKAPKVVTPAPTQNITVPSQSNTSEQPVVTSGTNRN